MTANAPERPLGALPAGLAAAVGLTARADSGQLARLAGNRPQNGRRRIPNKTERGLPSGRSGWLCGPVRCAGGRLPGLVPATVISRCYYTVILARAACGPTVGPTALVPHWNCTATAL
jgi:hypothetical protein